MSISRRKSHYILRLFCFILLLLYSQAGWSKKSNYETYHNFQYSFALSYPKNLFKLTGGASHQNETSFISADGLSKMSIQGEYLNYQKNLNQIIQERLELIKKYKLINKVVNPKSFTLAYQTEDEKQVLEKYVLHHKIIKKLHIEYPLSQKNNLQPIMLQIAKSFPAP